jgi:hypothetical protein
MIGAVAAMKKYMSRLGREWMNPKGGLVSAW